MLDTPHERSRQEGGATVSDQSTLRPEWETNSNGAFLATRNSWFHYPGCQIGSDFPPNLATLVARLGGKCTIFYRWKGPGTADKCANYYS